MKTLICIPALLLGLAAGAQAADLQSEKRVVDAKVQRVVVDGVIDVKVKQGATPSLIVYAEKHLIGKINTQVTGDTLRIDTNFESGKVPEIRAELTLPALQALTAAGVGKSEMSGFSGDRVQIELKGAGALSFQGSYKQVNATLSGLGAMNMQLADTENIDFHLSGAGAATLRGQGKGLKADLSGLGSMDARKFEVETLALRLKGMGSASAFASKSAAVSVSGMGSATVYGNPGTRSSSNTGLGSVTWK